MKAKKKYSDGGKVKNLKQAAEAAKKQRGKYSKTVKPIDRFGSPNERVKPISKVGGSSAQKAPESMGLSQDSMASITNIMRKIQANPQKATDKNGFPTYRQKKF